MKKLFLISILYIFTSCDNNNVQMSKETYEQLVANQKEYSAPVNKKPIIIDADNEQPFNKELKIVYDNHGNSYLRQKVESYIIYIPYVIKDTLK